MADARMTLPCSMKHWDAESAYAWSSLQAMSNSLPANPKLQPVLKGLIDGDREAAESMSNERHRIIVLLSLSRKMWSLREIVLSPVGDIVGNKLEEARQQILDTIDWFWQYPVLMSRSHTRTEIARSVHTMHIVHLAHIHGAGTLMNFYFPFLRNCLLHRTQDDGASRALLEHWAAENPRLTRDVAFHCAQILALGRQFPENMSMEPFLVFHAGVLLMSMGLVLPAVQRWETGLRLDHLGSPGDPIMVSISKWIREGGDEVVGLHGVPVLCCETGWKLLLDETAGILGRLRVWKLTQALRKVVLAIREGLSP